MPDFIFILFFIFFPVPSKLLPQKLRHGIWMTLMQKKVIGLHFMDEIPYRGCFLDEFSWMDFNSARMASIPHHS
jgi:hypothetical protein